MATVKEVVLKHHKKADDTWNVKIRITQGNTSAYITTPYFVTSKQLKKDFSIKDMFVVDQVSPIIADYRKKITFLGLRANAMSAKQIADHLEKLDEPVEDGVNFGKFCKELIVELFEKDPNSGTARNYSTVFRSLVDFFGHDNFKVSEITANKLKEYEEFLKTPRIISRENQFSKVVKTKSDGVGNALYNYMRDLRGMFNIARYRFNDEELGVVKIHHYPFNKYKVGSPPKTRKRNLDIESVRLIRNHNVHLPNVRQSKKTGLVGTAKEIHPSSKVQLAKDMAMLSFYLCGMNAKDIYEFVGNYDERIDYNRAKTKSRRGDQAFISIKVPPDAKPLLNKYVGKLKDRFSTSSGFNAAIADGIKKLSSEILEDKNVLIAGDKPTFGHIRHTFGTLARNVCGFSKDDVAMAMNHSDPEHKITDIYIAIDWSIVDRVQAGVLALL